MRKIHAAALVAAGVVLAGAASGVAYATISDSTMPVSSESITVKTRVVTDLSVGAGGKVVISCGDGKAISGGALVRSNGGGFSGSYVTMSYPELDQSQWAIEYAPPTATTTVTLSVVCYNHS